MNVGHLTITETLKLLRGKKVSALELVRSQLDQISKFDQKIGSYLSVREQGVLKEAENLDREGDFSLPLAGVPIAIKDVLVTIDTPTTAGSKILEGYTSPYQATAVAKLRAAGAIVLGKTNCDEFAMGSSTENSGYHPTRNPWDLRRVPGGSGGGSAAAVAANLAVAALGSDTGGSIRQPASFTGTVGLKPTYGRVSRYGLIALASSLDTVGPVTKDVTDAARLLSVIAGFDPNDLTSLADPIEDYTKDLDKLNLKGLKIGLPKEYFGTGIATEVKDAVLAVAKKLSKLGAKVSWVSLPSSAQALSVYYIIMPSEASSNLARYDGIRFGKRATGKDILEVYTKSRAQGLGDEPKRRTMLGTYSLSAGYYDAYYARANEVRDLVREDFAQAWQKVDLLLSPTAPSTAFPFGAKKTPLEMYLSDILTLPSNLAGNTAISVPIALSSGLPIGLQIIGPELAEKKVLQLAKTVEDLAQFKMLEEVSGTI